MAKNFKSNPAKTVLTITVGLLIIFMISHHQWLLTIAVVLGIIGVFSHYLSEKIEWLWMKIGWLLGLIVPKILLSIIFYLLLFPLAFLTKVITGKDPLMLKKQDHSTFRNVDKTFNKADFENPW